MNIMSLLQQMSGAVPRPEDTIVVGATPSEPNVDPQGPEPPFMGNRRYLDEAATANTEPLPQSVQQGRRGLFGTRGTLRDVLGTIGDAFLTANGGDATYAPQRERERLADAMVGFTRNRDAAIAAAERMAQAGFTEQANTLYQQVQQDDLRQATLQNAQATQQATNTNRARDDARTLSQVGANMFAAAGNDPENINRALTILQRMAQANGLTLEQLGIVPGMTPEDFALYAEGGWNVNQQRNYPLAQARVTQGQQNADANTLRASRAPAPRAPRSQTELEYYQELSNIPAGQRTAEQQTWMDDYVGMNDRRASRSRASQRAQGVTTRSGRTFTPVN